MNIREKLEQIQARGGDKSSKFRGSKSAAKLDNKQYYKQEKSDLTEEQKKLVKNLSIKFSKPVG